MTTTPMTRSDADEVMYRALTAVVADLDGAGVELSGREIGIAKAAILAGAKVTLDLCQERGVIAS